MDALNPAGPPDYKTGAIADNRSRVIGVMVDWTVSAWYHAIT